MNVTGKPTKNFGLREMACNDPGNTLEITPELVDHAQRLQRFRDWYNRPMQVNSWYRTPEWNAKQPGSSKDSQHLKGVATDIALPEEYFKMDKQRKDEFINNIKNKWQLLCQADGLRGGVGFYTNFVHLDSREGSGPIAFWDER